MKMPKPYLTEGEYSMTVFKYSGRTSTGNLKKGTIDAETEAAAIAKLRRTRH